MTDATTKAWARHLYEEIKSGEESRAFWERVGATKAAQFNDMKNALMSDAMLSLYLQCFAPPPNPMRLAVRRVVSNWR